MSPFDKSLDLYDLTTWTQRCHHVEDALLDLPPGIWSKICKLAVEQSIAVRAMSIIGRCCRILEVVDHLQLLFEEGTYEICKNEPAFTQVCCAIRKECLAHFYKSNTFFCYDFAPKQFLNSIGSECRRALGSIYILYTRPAAVDHQRGLR